ncbi:hypothetical protein ACFYZJ_34910 [Streptomyces sp. NPDC001848]|uniref:hypothetical protein n=1 Tax=Streptomyces sp. NPDC001848 TaxID=3364618 RepID=UPI00367481D9
MAKKKRTKAAKAYRQAKRLQERVAQEQAVLAQRRATARQQAVGDGVSKPPPDNPVSVRTIPSAVESGRRRH